MLFPGFVEALGNNLGKGGSLLHGEFVCASTSSDRSNMQFDIEQRLLHMHKIMHVAQGVVLW